MWQLLHRVLVPAGYPFINHSITVQSQKTRVSGPHESRGVFRPPLRHSHEGSPELIRFYPLFPKSAIIKSFRTNDDRIGCDKGVDHFTLISERRSLSYTRHILLFSSQLPTLQPSSPSSRTLQPSSRSHRWSSRSPRWVGEEGGPRAPLFSQYA